MRKIRILAVLLAALGLLALCAEPVQAAESRQLKISTPSQLASNWCWAAAMQGVIKYETGRQVSECSIVKLSQQKPFCNNRTAADDVVRTGLHTLGIPAVTLGPPGLGQLQNYIRAGRPVLVLWGWDGAGLVGHFVVVKGFRGNTLTVDYVGQPTRTIQMPYNRLMHDGPAFYPGGIFVPAHTLGYIIVVG